MLTPELMPIEHKWLLLGEKMSGGASIYIDIDTNVGPLSASVYWLLHNLFGKSTLSLHLAALILIFAQAMIFNFTMDRTDVLKERSYIPSLLYITFSVMYTDMLTLSPLLMSATFLLISIRELLYLLKNGNEDQGVFKVGFYIGIASLFYFPNIIFLGLVVMSYLLYTNTILRRYFILLFGFFFPILMMGMHYLIKGDFVHFIDYFWWKSLFIKTVYYIGSLDFLILLVVPAVFLIYSIFRVLTSRGYVTYQSKIQRIMSIWVLCSIAVYMISDEKSSFQLILLVPVLSYFGTGMFFLVRKSLFRELIYAGTTALILFVHIGSLNDVGEKVVLNPENISLVNNEITSAIKGKKMFVIGKSFDNYKNNSVATRFFDWRISTKYFLNLDYMKNPDLILKEFQKDPPEVIVDNLGVAPKLFERVLAIDNNYKPHPTLKDVYIRKKGFNLESISGVNN